MPLLTFVFYSFTINYLILLNKLLRSIKLVFEIKFLIFLLIMSLFLIAFLVTEKFFIIDIYLILITLINLCHLTQSLISNRGGAHHLARQMIYSMTFDKYIFVPWEGFHKGLLPFTLLCVFIWKEIEDFRFDFLNWSFILWNFQ